MILFDGILYPKQQQYLFETEIKKTTIHIESVIAIHLRIICIFLKNKQLLLLLDYYPSFFSDEEWIFSLTLILFEKSAAPKCPMHQF